MTLLSQSKGFRSPSPESGEGMIKKHKPNCDAEQNEASEEEKEKPNITVNLNVLICMHVSFLENESCSSSGFSGESHLSDWKSVFTQPSSSMMSGTDSIRCKKSLLRWMLVAMFKMC